MDILLHSTGVQSNNNNLNEDGYRPIEKSQASEPLIHLAGAPDYSAKKSINFLFVLAFSAIAVLCLGYLLEALTFRYAYDMSPQI
ncbi:hypothetical protein JTE90_016166 [Oedothorax gibbosus]|uniref:Uncharacterized protein n=1 Tax=Oedothorax gibbosus TaxID=931172 RepID=A0AAV6UTA5_9ARAC|nr:hypothetical protein JTE90_016166 [Oedothorax gibbosus]